VKFIHVSSRTLGYADGALQATQGRDSIVRTGVFLRDRAKLDTRFRTYLQRQAINYLLWAHSAYYYTSAIGGEGSLCRPSSALEAFSACLALNATKGLGRSAVPSELNNGCGEILVALAVLTRTSGELRSMFQSQDLHLGDGSVDLCVLGAAVMIVV